MAVERARRREPAELHSDHFLIDGHRHELAAVVDIEGEADELRQDRRTARPSLDRRSAALFLRRFSLLQQRKLDERTFPDGTGHGLTLLLRVTATDDELIRCLVVTGAGTLGRLAPRGNRMTAARGPAFTTAMRVVDRVLGDAAGQRALAEPAVAAGLGEALVGIVRVGHRADRRHAVRADIALLARVQADDDHAAIAPDDLDIGAGGTCDLAAFAGLQLDIVDDRADRNLADLHRIARLHVRLLGGDDAVADAEALRRDDIGELAVGIFHQRDEGRAIGIIFDPLDNRRDIPFAP